MTNLSADYQAAIAAHNKACHEYNVVLAAYRAFDIGDAEFLTAKALKIEADRAFDAAFEAEADN